MANYTSTTRTNYFRVTDEKKYAELYAGLSGEGGVMDFSFKADDGTVFHGFGAYSFIDWYEKLPNFNEIPDDDSEYPDPDFDHFLHELQKILPENEAFIYLHCGNEKLRYLAGQFIVATREEVRWGEINNAAIKTARDMLGDPEWTSKTSY